MDSLIKSKRMLSLLIVTALFIAGCVPSHLNTILNKQERDAESIHEIPPLPPDIDDETPVAPQEKESTDAKIPPQADPVAHPKELVGSWRALSSRIFYDIGGGGALGSGTGRPLEINQDGSWQFGTSAGTWEVVEIKVEDWKKWNVSAYGPKKKMVLSKWNKNGADGPIEESDSKVDFFWVIYKAEPPTVSAAGQIQVKYGHTE